MEDELMSDELPSPPQGEVRAIEDEIDAAAFTDVPKMGEAIPVGTYHFRLEKFEERWKDKDDKGNEIPEAERNPYFALQWKCQQEPYTGRVVFDNVPWVRQKDVQDAASQDSPRRAEARKLLNNRLPKAKEIMEAAGFLDAGRGKFNFKAFLGTNPEMKLQLKVKERQSKGPDGKYRGNGEWGNEISRHISLHRPM